MGSGSRGSMRRLNAGFSKASHHLPGHRFLPFSQQSPSLTHCSPYKPPRFPRASPCGKATSFSGTGLVPGTAAIPRTPLSGNPTISSLPWPCLAPAGCSPAGTWGSSGHPRAPWGWHCWGLLVSLLPVLGLRWGCVGASRPLTPVPPPRRGRSGLSASRRAWLIVDCSFFPIQEERRKK